MIFPKIFFKIDLEYSIDKYPKTQMTFNISKKDIYKLGDTITEKQSKINRYYDICMPEDYENFNYINSLIKKNKSIGILSKISTDIITQEISKYISGKGDMGEWRYSPKELEIYVRNKFIEKYPEIERYIGCVRNYNDFKEEYLKSNEYAVWRRQHIEEYKEEFLEDIESDIHLFKELMEEDNERQRQLIKGYCDFQATLYNLLEGNGKFKTLSIHYIHIHNETLHLEEHFQIKNCNKTFKISSTEKFSNYWSEMRVKQLQKKFTKIHSYSLDLDCYLKNISNGKINITIDCEKLSKDSMLIIGL